MDFAKFNVDKVIKTFNLSHQYSDNIIGQSIVILGPLPPPLGGISVHIKRVSAKLRIQKNLVYNFDTINCPIKYPLCIVYLVLFLVFMRPDIIYYHTLYGHGLIELQVIRFFKRIFGCKLIIVEHDCRFLYDRSLVFKKKYNYILQNIDQLVLIGDTTVRSYKENGITVPINTTVESAFLPPIIDEEAEILSTYPDSLFVFLQKREPLLCINAFQLNLLGDKDLYGVDLAIKAMGVLINERFPNIGLIIVLARVGNVTYYDQILQLIRQNNLQDNCYFLIDQKELWPLFRKIDLFIRPSLSDGNSVSVAEASFFKIAIVASDCCIRPEGTFLFKTGDQTDFIQKVRMALDSA